MTSNIEVAIRIRPFNNRELTEKHSNSLVLSPNAVSLRDSVFQFDHIFTQETSNTGVFETFRGVVQDCLEGIHGTIFAYGQTSSGKTYTMHGSPSDPGIVSCAIQMIFDHVNRNETREFLLRVSYLEIYNENLKDLLNPENENLKIHENVQREIFIGDLTEVVVTSPEQVKQLLLKGEGNRKVGETNMNERSSRSHTIFKMIIESRQLGDEVQGDLEGTKTRGRNSLAGGTVRVSCLNLVDLAGSERAGHTGAEGLRLREGGHINKSLLALASVIQKLSEGGDRHIPYRDSKLTRILQPSLGGNAKTAIICTITPSSMYTDETLSTLKFASRAKICKTRPEVNEVVSDEVLIKKYVKEIKTLKDQLTAVQNENLGDKLRETEMEKERLSLQIEKLKRMILSHSHVTQSDTEPLKEAENNAESEGANKRRRRQTWFPRASASSAAPPLIEKMIQDVRDLSMPPLPTDYVSKATDTHDFEQQEKVSVAGLLKGLAESIDISEFVSLEAHELSAQFSLVKQQKDQLESLVSEKSVLLEQQTLLLEQKKEEIEGFSARLMEEERKTAELTASLEFHQKRQESVVLMSERIQIYEKEREELLLEKNETYKELKEKEVLLQAKIDDLKALQDAIDRISSEKGEISKENEEMRRRHQENQRELEVVSGEKQVLLQEVEQLRASEEQLKSLIEMEKAEISRSKEQEIEEIERKKREERASLETELSAAREALLQIQRENNQLREEKDRLQASFNEEKLHFALKIDELQEQVQEIQEANESLVKNNEEGQLLLKENQKGIENLKRDLLFEKKEKEGAERKAAEFERQVSQVKKEISLLKEKHQKEREEKKREISELKEARDALIEEKQELQEQLEHVMQQGKTLLGTVYSQIKELRTGIEAVQDELLVSQGRFRESIKETRDELCKVITSQPSAKEYDDVISEVLVLRESIAASKTRNEALEGDLKEYKEEVGKRGESISHLNSKLKKQTEQFMKLSSDAQVVFDKYKLAKERLGRMREEYSKIEELNEKSKQKNEILQLQNEQLLEKRDSLLAENKALRIRVEGLEGELDEQNKSTTGVELITKQIRDEFDLKMEEKERFIDSLRQNMSLLEKELSQRIQETKGVREEEIEKIKEKEAKINELHVAFVSLHETLAALFSTLDESLPLLHEQEEITHDSDAILRKDKQSMSLLISHCQRLIEKIQVQDVSFGLSDKDIGYGTVAQKENPLRALLVENVKNKQTIDEKLKREVASLHRERNILKERIEELEHLVSSSQANEKPLTKENVNPKADVPLKPVRSVKRKSVSNDDCKQQ